MYAEERSRVLEHYGVKGMKWGQRKARDSGGLSKRMVRKDARWEKKADSMKTTLAVYNKTADYMNKTGLNQLNNDPKFKGKDLTKDNKLMAAYNKRHEEIYTKAYGEAARSFKSPSGTKQLNAKVKGDYLEISVEEVKHADEGNRRYFLVRDEKGHVLEMVEEEMVLAQMSMTTDEFIAHYGVKGMKWGQRKAAYQKNRQLNKASRARDRAEAKEKVATAKEKHKRDVDAAREAVKSGKVKSDYKEVKALSKERKTEIGSREARKMRKEARNVRYDTIAKSREIRDGKEFTAKLLSDVLVGTQYLDGARTWRDTYDDLYNPRTPKSVNTRR